MAKFTLMQKQKILDKTNRVCAACGKKLTLNTFTIDHYIPKSLHGKNATKNLIPLCKECNLKKGNKILEPNDAYPFLNLLHKSELEDILDNFYEKEH